MSDDALLYVRQDCELCEQAEDWLDAHGIAYQCRHIDNDLQQLMRYRQRIPVLCIGGRELDWPFAVGDLQAR